MQSFAHVSRLFGHDPRQLREGAEIVTFPRIPTTADGRRVLSRATPRTRSARSAVFYQGIEKRRRLFQGMHDRGEEYIFADGFIHAADRRNTDHHLPLHTKLVSVRTKVVRENEVWDLTLPYDHYGFGPREELYVAVNVDTLILEPNARVIIQGNVFSLSCQRIVRRGNQTPGITTAYDIGILPTTRPVDNRTGPLDAAHRPAGADGADGAHGRSHGLVGGMFGPAWDPEATPPEAGHGGTDGRSGRDGQNGRIGPMVKLAEITIGALEHFEEHPLRIFSQPGNGGRGGNGGQGGRGGHGGNGGHGILVGDRQLDPGAGGDGGNGGRGGRGGHGGNGGIASNIFVSLPASCTDKLVTESLPCRGGTGGRGGQSGLAGRGGRGGTLGNTAEEVSAAAGANGAAGTPGRKGSDGRSRPGPNFFVFPSDHEQAVTPDEAECLALPD